MSQHADDTRELYLASFKGFADSLNGQSSASIHAIRKDAIERFSNLGFPTTRSEAWIHTNVANLAKTAFVTPAEGLAGITSADVDALSLGVETRLVFVNGRYAAELSNAGSLPVGVRVEDLASALDADDPIVAEHITQVTAYEANAFRALNTAFVRDGAFIYIPRGVAVEEPIHIIHLSSAQGDPTVSHPRSLIVGESGSQAVVIESYAGAGSTPYFTNAVTEIVAGDNANLKYYKRQLEREDAYHVSTVKTKLGRDARTEAYSFDLGGLLVRNETDALLDGEGCEATVNGFYLLHDKQHVDNHTLIEHAQPHCSSHELYKGVLGGNSRGVFRGKIFVHQIAQKTDAYQQNQNLLLSDSAEANSKPQLEIYADDVKCSHGATIGQLDKDALFYLRSRGISADDARQLLVQAFGSDVIDRVVVDALREDLHKRTFEKFSLQRKAQG